MNEKVARITINTYYENLQNATTTNERYHWLNAAINLLNQFPNLGTYFTICNNYFVAGRLRRTADFEDFNLASVPRFNDGIDRQTEKAFKKIEGLYFLGEVSFDPETAYVLYWVKIGYSSDLKSRLRNYDTHCPTTWRIDFSTDAELEHHYHKLLGACCIDRAAGNDEWFRVDRETYLEMCEKGFSYFN